jgi:hypothetical protein
LEEEKVSVTAIAIEDEVLPSQDIEEGITASSLAPDQPVAWRAFFERWRWRRPYGADLADAAAIEVSGLLVVESFPLSRLAEAEYYMVVKVPPRAERKIELNILSRDTLLPRPILP